MNSNLMLPIFASHPYFTRGFSLMLNMILGTVISILGLVFLEPLLNLFGASEQTMPYAKEYMRILLYGNIVTHVYLGFNEILRASGYPKKAMGIMLTAIVLNCGLDALFIFVFDWGIMGAAVATVMAQCVAFVLELTHFLNRKNFLYVKAGTFRLIGAITKKILAIGAAPFLVNVCSSVVVLFINRALRDYGGDISIGAYSIVNRIVMLFIMIVAGFNQGMQPIVGFNFGARQFDRVLRVLKITILCAVGVTSFGFVFCMVFPNLVVGMFTSDPVLLGVAEQGLRIVVLALPIVGFQIVSSNFFQYIGQPQKAIVLSMTRQLLFLVPMLAILPQRYGTLGVWVSMPVADVLAAIFTGILLFLQVRKFRRNPESIRVI